MNLPEIFANENLKNDFFELPDECIEYIIENKNTCVSEILLYKNIEEKVIFYQKLNCEDDKDVDKNKL